MDRFALWLGRMAAWGFLIIVAMMVYEVIARYGFNAPTFWAHEIAGVLAAIAFILGGAYCMADNSHMRITALVDQAGPRMKAVSRYLSLIAGAIYLAGLAYAAARMSRDSLFRFSIDGTWDPERSGTSWNTPAPSIIKFMLCVGAVLFLALVIRRLFLRADSSEGRDH